MKTELQTITPSWAKEVLESKNTNNRRLNQKWVDKIARDIKANAFVTTHQGIAFYENGMLADGQHRLAAIEKANRAVVMCVTYDIPMRHQVNGTHIETWNAIDQGGKRCAGEVLRLEGIPNANRLAALARALINACCKSPNANVSVPQIRLAIHAAGQSAETCVTLSNAHKLQEIHGCVMAAIVLLHTKFPTEAENFIREVGGITGSLNSPSRALVTWLRRHPGSAVSPVTRFKVTASALKAHVSNSPRSKIYASEESYQWLLQQNPELVGKIRKMMDN